LKLHTFRVLKRLHLQSSHHSEFYDTGQLDFKLCEINKNLGPHKYLALAI